MDKTQQLPLSQQPLSPPPKGLDTLDLTSQQERILLQMLARSGGNLLALTFNDPEQDGLKLRQHAYMKGELDTLNLLLQYDARNRADAEEAQRLAATGDAPEAPEGPEQF